MRAICRSNCGSAIPMTERYWGETEKTDYSPLSIGDEYFIYALLFVSERVDFLVGVPGQFPFWVPSSLFELVDDEIPVGWKFCATQFHSDYKVLFESFKVKCIVGYSLLVREYQHYVGVVERDPVELERFMFENCPEIVE
ncbi:MULTISPECIES: hypothetical protein [unclassified Pseudomonas]|uniref:hypothetical protein n=1 Tax=unclassified Pseudomonas TaxID=196821 RepID=UPI00128D47E1|nr:MULTISPECIES: hypothetical protein [unclassified Pseudomonas]MPQ69199.1 hypothetical protein [Pseudomonas sp. MWU12-2323]